jgi:hypothetical protein
MTANLQDGTVTVLLRSPHGNVLLGDFTVDAGRVHGTDRRGVSYQGTCIPAADGVSVELTMTVPSGTRLTEALLAEEQAEHELSFHLSEEHLAGIQAKPVVVPGLGSADLIFTVW